MAEKQKRAYPPFYEKVVPIAVAIITLLVILLVAFAFSLIIQ
jgi:hypothetical protein